MSNDFDDRDGLDDAATPQGRLLYSRLTKHVRLRQLQLLVALQQCGSVVQAAATLHMSQSAATQAQLRSEEHTSELQSHSDLVCRLLLEKKKNNKHACIE